MAGKPKNKRGIEIKESLVLLDEVDNIFFTMNSPERQYALYYLVAKYGQGKQLREK